MRLFRGAALFILIAEASFAAVLGSEPEELESRCCSALVTAVGLEGKVLSRGDDAYENQLLTYYSANAALRAWCMVMPEKTEDVSRIAKILFHNQCPFGIRSGGHSTFKKSNAIDEGITVDFSYMNTTSYQNDTKIASIQPGATWGSVYQTLQPYGVSTVGGRASVVGVGGFTTGCGYSFHSNSRGFACDLVTNWEIVLANGTVVNANENENSDLWKAQKGSSGNLGFVTRIDQHTIDSTDIWGGSVSYDASSRDEVFNAYIDFAENMSSDPASQATSSISYNDEMGFSLGSKLTNTDMQSDAPVLRPFLSIANTSSSIKSMHLADFVEKFVDPSTSGLYSNWFTGTTRNDIRVLELFDTKLHNYVDKMKSCAPESKLNIHVGFQPIPNSVVEQSLKHGGNMFGLESLVTEGPLLMWLISLTLDTAESQEKILPLAIDFRDSIDQETAKMGLYVNWKWLNYAWKDQDPLSYFGDENIAFIKSVADAYDPTGFFQGLRGSGFKIPA